MFFPGTPFDPPRAKVQLSIRVTEPTPSLSGHLHHHSYRRNLVFPANPPSHPAYIPPSRHRSSPAISQHSNPDKNPAFLPFHNHSCQFPLTIPESVPNFVAISQFPDLSTRPSAFTTAYATHYPPPCNGIARPDTTFSGQPHTRSRSAGMPASYVHGPCHRPTRHQRPQPR